MRLFDLHCDTLFTLYSRKEGFYKNSGHISLDRTEELEEYTQVLAIWSENSLTDDEAYLQYGRILDNFKALLEKDGLPKNFRYRLAVEGGKLLGNDINRLYRLKEDGMELLTLVWGGMCSVGGAHNTEEGLSSFGMDLVKECLEIGIIPDISHASDRSFYDTAEIFGRYNRAMLATHSNSRSVRQHSRNLSDEMFSLIRQSGGIVGISLCPEHLCEGKCGIEDIIRHIDRYMEMDGENTVAMGWDLDGIDSLPEGISGPESVFLIDERLASLGYTEEQRDKIFYKNAARFMK
ncbi:MAG: hypothetical protein E7623_00385 [Ruminococcaceae bacterium]|nr:hypothetical protein [Oscillospiraceae bacterium]